MKGVDKNLLIPHMTNYGVSEVSKISSITGGLITLISSLASDKPLNLESSWGASVRENISGVSNGTKLCFVTDIEYDVGLGTMKACFPSSIFKDFEELKKVISASSNHNRMMILISGFVIAFTTYRITSRMGDFIRSARRLN